MSKSTKSNAIHDESNPSYSAADRKSSIIASMNNFGKYGNATVAIPRNSTTLINGKSGSGKTTIMEFFLYVLFDSVTYPERIGTKTCWGWLINGNVVVYRQKNPKLLKVWINDISSDSSDDLKIPVMSGQEFTGLDAQEEVNRRFGSHDVFIATSYLRQKEFSPLLSGTDAQKLAIIKEVASRGSEFDGVRDPIKEKLQQLQAETISTQAQFRQALSAAQKFDVQYPNIVNSKPVEMEDSEVTMGKIRTLRESLNTLNAVYTQAVQQESKIGHIEREISGTALQIEGYRKQIEAHKDRNFEDEASKIDLEIATLQGDDSDAKNRILADLYNQWSASRDRFKRAYEENLHNIQEILKSLNTHKSVFGDVELKVEEIENAGKWIEMIDAYIAKFESYIKAEQILRQKLSNSGHDGIESLQAAIPKAKSDVEVLEGEVAKIKTEIEEHRKKLKWDCPQCGTTLIMSEDKKSLQKSESQSTPAPVAAPVVPVQPAPVSLFRQVEPEKPPPAPEPVKAVKVHEEVPPCKYSHDDLFKATTELAGAKARLESLSGHLEEITKSSKELEELKASLAIDPAIGLELKNKSYSSSLAIHAKTFVASKSDLENHLKVEPQKVDEVVGKKDNSTRIAELREQKTRIQQDKDQFGSFRLMIGNYEKHHESLLKQKSEYLAENVKASAEVAKEMQQIQGDMDRLLHLNSSSDLIAQRGIIQKTMEEQAEKAKVAQARFEACQRLETKAIEAERIALDSSVAEINALLADILRTMFIESPISVELRTTKELKSKKGVSQRFDMPIIYGSSSYTTYKQLSGGEKDRLSIAITMALSIKFGSSILFLDETLSSLDPEIKGRVISLLKDFSGEGRIVLAASHEETEGFYDRVIRLG